MDESLSSEEEAVPLKRRRVEVSGEELGNKEPMRGDPELAIVTRGWHGFRRRDCVPFRCGDCSLVKGRCGRGRVIRGNRVRFEK